jgi:hypothetical protein
LVDLEAPAFSTPRARTIVEGSPKQGLCQVRSETDLPCPHQAVVEIWGIPFCEWCAREQEAYFAIGKLTQEEETRGLRDEPLDEELEPLGEALGRMRRERTGYTAAAGKAKVTVGDPG